MVARGAERLGSVPPQGTPAGDRLVTDLTIGRQGGLRTVLPLTGVTTEEPKWGNAARKCSAGGPQEVGL